MATRLHPYFTLKIYEISYTYNIYNTIVTVPNITATRGTALIALIFGNFVHTARRILETDVKDLPQLSV